MRRYFFKHIPIIHYLCPQSPFQEALSEWRLSIVQKLLIVGFILNLFSCQQNKNHQLTIAAASNMQFVMEVLTASFTQETGVVCQTVISSSGKLTAQIKENAPYDIFVSANMKYPNELFRSGFSQNKPEVYAHGKLVLWSMNEKIEPSMEILLDNKVKHIAIANPKTAPYGSAAIEVLKSHNIYEDVKHKLVYGESIAQTNQFILSQSAEIGFTAKSVLLSPKMKDEGRWITIDDNSYSPISQGIVLIKTRDKKNKDAQQFQKFLFSKTAKNILKTYGYLVK